MSTQTVTTAPSAEPPAAERRARRRRSPHREALWAAATAGLATALSTLGVATLLSGTRWLTEALAGIAGVLVIGAFARALRCPRPVLISVQLIAALGYLTALYAREDAVGGVLPGPDATERLGDRLDAGFTALDGVTPPFTPGPDAAMVAVVGVLLTAIAVDALAAGYRRPLLAGIPVLVLYAVPAFAMDDGPRSWWFVLPALGLLVLLVGDSRRRLELWGLLADRADLARSGTRRTGAHIGFWVLSIALVVPAAVPTFTGDLFDGGARGSDDKPIITLDPLVEMRRNLVRPADLDLLTVTSISSRPEEQYLRAVNLDEFTGTQWRAGDRELRRFDRTLPAPVGLNPSVPASPVQSSVEALPRFATDYLPMPFPATAVDIEGNWRVDPASGNVLSLDGLEQISGLSYGVTGLELEPDANDVGVLNPADPGLARYLALPQLPDRIANTARRITEGAEGPLQIGLRLQAWLRNPANFTYDLRTPQGSGSDALLDFLAQRRGYCEQFASLMAVFARSLGVPARLGVGFTAGETTPSGRTISAHDAHAWPELFLPGVGWTRFEPTPGDASSDPTVPSWLGSSSPAPNDGDAGEDEAAGAVEPSAPSESATPDNGDAAECAAGDPECQGALVDAPDDDSRDWLGALLWIGGVLLALAVLLGIPWLIRFVQRRRRYALISSPRRLARASAPAPTVIAEVAWVELRDTSIDLGYSWPPSCTPRQAAALLKEQARLRGHYARALLAITALVEQSRYSATGAGTTDGALVRRNVEEVRALLAQSTGPDERLRARLAPRSLRATVFRPTLRTLRHTARRAVRLPGRLASRLLPGTARRGSRPVS